MGSRRTHVTLGLLRTGLKNVDRSLIRMNGDVTRKVDAVFSPSEGNPKLAMMSRRFSLNIERVKTKYLGRLRISEMSGDGYSQRASCDMPTIDIIGFVSATPVMTKPQSYSSSSPIVWHFQYSLAIQGMGLEVKSWACSLTMYS